MRARLKRLLLRVWPVLALLHVYIGAQLLPSYGPAARFAGAMLLGLSALLIPLGFLRAPRAGLRPARPPRGSSNLGAARRLLESAPRAGLRPARPPRGSSNLGAAQRLLESAPRAGLRPARPPSRACAGLESSPPAHDRQAANDEARAMARASSLAQGRGAPRPKPRRRPVDITCPCRPCRPCRRPSGPPERLPSARRPPCTRWSAAGWRPKPRSAEPYA